MFELGLVQVGLRIELSPLARRVYFGSSRAQSLTVRGSMAARPMIVNLYIDN